MSLCLNGYKTQTEIGAMDIYVYVCYLERCSGSVKYEKLQGTFTRNVWRKGFVIR